MRLKHFLVTTRINSSLPVKANLLLKKIEKKTSMAFSQRKINLTKMSHVCKRRK
jgi:hypothetical protein